MILSSIEKEKAVLHTLTNGKISGKVTKKAFKEIKMKKKKNKDRNKTDFIEIKKYILANLHNQ